MKIFRLIFILVVLIFTVWGCSKTYTFAMFSYPPNSKPHEHNWEYLGQITVWHPGAPVEREKKKLRIVIKDRKDEILLDEKYVIFGGIFNHQVNWGHFDNIKITTTEKSSKSKKPVLELNYLFNGKNFIIKKG